MRIVLTGAGGFLGREIARELRARGHRVAGMRRRLDGQSPDDFIGDFLQPESYRDSLRHFAPDILIHCGWHGVPARSRDLLDQLDNVPAAVRLAEAGADAGAKLVIGLGTQAEYGAYDHPVREDEIGRPVTLYAIAKLAAGQAFLRVAKQKKIRGIWARIFSLYGPRETAPSMLPWLAREFASGRVPSLTACTQVWDFLHVRDGARAIADLAESQSAEGLFNVASGNAPILRDTVVHLRDLMAKRIAPDFGSVPFGPDQIMYLAGNIAKLQEATGWHPRISMAEGLAELAEEARQSLE